MIDENVSRAVARGLRRRNIDAVALREVDRLGLPDESQLQWAYEQRRVVITHDEDYVSLGFGSTSHAGVGYCHQEKYFRRPGALVRRLEQLQTELSAEDWAGRVIFL